MKGKSDTLMLGKRPLQGCRFSRGPGLWGAQRFSRGLCGVSGIKQAKQGRALRQSSPTVLLRTDSVFWATIPFPWSFRSTLVRSLLQMNQSLCPQGTYKFMIPKVQKTLRSVSHSSLGSDLVTPSQSLQLKLKSMIIS